MIKGSCLCGEVCYRINGKLGNITHCHCSTCRKAHGAAFSSVAAVPIDGFEITAGENLLKHYFSSPDKQRYFAQTVAHNYTHTEMGSSIIFYVWVAWMMIQALDPLIIFF